MRSELPPAAIEHAFKKGQSGNTRGRPVNNTAALLAAALNEMARGRPSPRTGSAGRSPKRKAVIANWSTNRPRPICGTSKKSGAGSDREKPIRSDRQIGGPITPLG
jgi:hypothetical protein